MEVVIYKIKNKTCKPLIADPLATCPNKGEGVSFGDLVSDCYLSANSEMKIGIEGDNWRKDGCKKYQS